MPGSNMREDNVSAVDLLFWRLRPRDYRQLYQRQP